MELLGVLFELKIKSQQKRYIWTNVYVFNFVFLCIAYWIWSVFSPADGWDKSLTWC